jgi:hypothetical protein
VEGSYNTVLETCIVLHTRKGLVNAIGALVVDVVLCIAMLIGLLRHAHISSTGIWHLLYQQVMAGPPIFLPSTADILQVHHLDSFGRVGGGAACGTSISVT